MAAPFRTILRPVRWLAALLCLPFLLPGGAAGQEARGKEPEMMQIDLRSGANGQDYRIFMMSTGQPAEAGLHPDTASSPPRPAGAG